MQILRTPDSHFENLADYPFAPHYTTIQTQDGSDLRIHHLDEGPADGPLVLCMHGQPVWSYLYRKVIPHLTAAGMRVIAPDLVGYGTDPTNPRHAKTTATSVRSIGWAHGSSPTISPELPFSARTGAGSSACAWL